MHENYTNSTLHTYTIHILVNYYLCMEILIDFRDLNAVISCAICMLVFICNIRKHVAFR